MPTPTLRRELSAEEYNEQKQKALSSNAAYELRKAAKYAAKMSRMDLLEMQADAAGKQKLSFMAKSKEEGLMFTTLEKMREALLMIEEVGILQFRESALNRTKEKSLLGNYQLKIKNKWKEISEIARRAAGETIRTAAGLMRYSLKR